MKDQSVHFMSRTDEWATPPDFFSAIQKEFNLNRDVCATAENAKLFFYWDKESDGLKQDWKDLRCWMNPPYGRQIGKWVEKAATGGGRNRGVSITREDRYQMVSRVHLQKSRDKIYKRSPEVRRIKELRPVS